MGADRVTRARRGRDAGQSTVELALVMPVLIVLIATAFQMSLLLAAEIALSNATRDGARWLAIDPDSVDTAAISTISSRVSAPLSASLVTVAVSPSCASLTSGRCSSRPAGTQLSVTLAYDARSLWLFHGFSFPSVARSYTVYMRAEPR